MQNFIKKDRTKSRETTCFNLQRGFNFTNFFPIQSGRSSIHTVEIRVFYCHNCFRKNSVKLTFYLKNFTINWFDGKKFAWQWIFHFSTLWHSNTVQCGNYSFFCKNCVKVMVALTKLLNSWFDEFFFSSPVRVNLSFCHTMA